MTTVQVVPRATELPVAQLTFDSDVQCRESIQMGVVAEYKESLANGVTFPPLVVFFDGKTNWVADGFHRGHAYRDTGVVTCPCDVRQGTKRDAILYACGANASHGLKRTNADKRRAVLTLLRDAEWSQWSDRELGRRAGVGHDMVASLRPAPLAENASQPEPRKCADGRTINTSNIGKTKAEKPEPPVEKPEEEPEAIEEPKSSHVGLVAIAEEEEDPRQPYENEEPEIFRVARTAIATIWSKCPVAFRWKLKASIENHLADLAEEG